MRDRGILMKSDFRTRNLPSFFGPLVQSCIVIIYYFKKKYCAAAPGGVTEERDTDDYYQ